MGQTNTITVEMADAIDHLVNAALGVGAILIDIANGMPDIERADREAFILLGFELRRQVDELRSAGWEVGD